MVVGASIGPQQTALSTDLNPTLPPLTRMDMRKRAHGPLSTDSVRSGVPGRGRFEGGRDSGRGDSEAMEVKFHFQATARDQLSNRGPKEKAPTEGAGVDWIVAGPSAGAARFVESVRALPHFILHHIGIDRRAGDRGVAQELLSCAKVLVLGVVNRAERVT